jgi:very-short-patch-repair endonuclease
MKPRQPLPAQFRGQPFRTDEANAAGLSHTRLRGNDLQRPFRGVRVASTKPLTLHERCHALHTRLAPDARYYGVTAAALLGVPLPHRLESSLALHVAVPSPRRSPTGRNVRGHSVVATEADVLLWKSLRVSNPARLWCELGETLTLPDLVAAGDYLIHWREPWVTVPELSRALGNYPGRRGLRTLHAALPLLNDRAESAQESRLRVLLVLGGIRDIEVNLPITTTGGYRYRADIALVSSKTIVEYQSEFHNSPAAFRADMTRLSRLEADGWTVMFVNAGDMGDPAELAARVTRVGARRA